MTDQPFTLQDLNRDYQEILAYFNGPESSKKEGFLKVLESNNHLFKGVQAIMKTGTPEEKKEAFTLFFEVFSLTLGQMQKMGEPGNGAQLEEMLKGLSPEQLNQLKQAKENVEKLKGDLKNIMPKKPIA